MTLIRYPGSKDKLTKTIRKHFPWAAQYALWSAASKMEYREPFFGAGSVGIKLIDSVLRPECRVWLNDMDLGIVSMWQAVQTLPAQLIKRIEKFTPSAEWFYSFKDNDNKHTGDIVEDGFRKLALHQMSYSGLGVKSGGPLGGKSQKNPAYNPACRWRPERLKLEVARVSKRLSRFKDLRITCGDFMPLVETAHENCFVYADPPYYEKGPQLYKHAMDPDDHERLAMALKNSPAHWVLSYDDHPEIRRLYSWAKFTQIDVTYCNATATGPTRPKNHEVVIAPHKSA
jgi:DNA adenine methylase